MNYDFKNFRKIIPLMAIGALGTACAPTPGAIQAGGAQASKEYASPTRTSLIHSTQGAAVVKEGTAYYPTSTNALGNTRATLIPPEQILPEYQTAAASAGVEPDATGAKIKPQFGSKPVLGHQSGRSLSEERDSFAGVDVASATDTGSSNNDSAGGGGNATASSPVSGSNRSSGGGSSSAARSR